MNCVTTFGEFNQLFCELNAINGFYKNYNRTVKDFCSVHCYWSVDCDACDVVSDVPTLFDLSIQTALLHEVDVESISRRFQRRIGALLFHYEGRHKKITDWICCNNSIHFHFLHNNTIEDLLKIYKFIKPIGITNITKLLHIEKEK